MEGPAATGGVPHLLTRHATSRIDARRIRQGVEAALRFGRVVHVRGARIYALGRKEVRKHARQGVNLGPHEGIQVVCSPDGAVLTAYRNRDFRGLKPRGRRRGRKFRW